jgi:hypothetical protein
MHVLLDTRPPVWPRAACALVAAIGFLAFDPPSRADEPSSVYSIACRVEADRDPSVSPGLVSAVRQRIQHAFAAVLGADQKLRFVDGTDAEALPPLDSVTPDSLLRQWTSADRLLLLSIGRSGTQWLLRAREYDPRFQILGPISETRTLQRELVPDAAGQLVLQSFSPIAVVRSATGTNVQLEFLGDQRLVNYRHWLGLSGDVGLQVIREPLGAAGSASGDSSRTTRYRSSFLALRSWQGNRAEGELIGPDKLFRDIDSAPVRYLARPVRGGNVSPHVRVIRKESRQPQPDCEVFVSPQQYSTDPSLLRGLTDRNGSLTVSIPGGGLQFLSVRYEDLVLKAPILPGASADPIVFEVPTRGRRAEFIRPLRQLLQEIDDQYRVELRLREELKTRVDAKDTAEVRRLIERGRAKRIGLDEIETQVREIERRAESEGEDVREAAAQVRQTAQQKTTRQLDQALASYSEWAERFDKKSSIETLNARINELQEKMDWEGLVPVFEQLIQADPDNQKVADELRLLKNDLKIKSPEHAEARAFVDDELKRITTRDLRDRWPEVEREVRALVKAKDHLTLLKVRRTMNTWVRELAVEVKGVIDQIQAAGQDDDRVRELRDRLEQLDTLNQSLTKLHKDIQSFLETLKL